MNKCVLIGRLVADPEMKMAQSGTAVTRYRIAVDRQRNKEAQAETDFLNCVAFGKGAEFANNYLHKGTKIAIEGRIQTGSYTKEDGTKVNTFDIVVERHEFCEGKASNAAQSAPVASAPASNSFEEIEDTSFDLPF